MDTPCTGEEFKHMGHGLAFESTSDSSDEDSGGHGGHGALEHDMASNRNIRDTMLTRRLALIMPRLP